MQTKFYKPYVPRFTVGELWRASNNPLVFLFLSFMKLFRVGTTAHFGIGLQDEKISLDQLPMDASQALLPLIEEWRQLGFSDGIVARELSLGNRQSFTVAMRSPDRLSYVSLSNIVTWQGAVH